MVKITGLDEERSVSRTGLYENLSFLKRRLPPPPDRRSGNIIRAEPRSQQMGKGGRAEKCLHKAAGKQPVYLGV